MSTITLRKMPKEVEKAVRRKAKSKRQSLAKTVVSILEENLGVAVKPGIAHHDLDPLAGRWTAAEARRFDSILAGHLRKIDEGLWT